MEHWKKRDNKRFNGRKHKVTGKSVFNILKIWERNWKDIKRKGKEGNGKEGKE